MVWFPLNYLASPKKFFHFSTKVTPWLTALFVLLLAYGLVGGLILAPADAVQGDGFRIIYVHVPCAFLSLFIYAVMTGAAVMGIAFRMKLTFAVMQHSVRLGTGFTFLALLTGSLWGKPMWGTWWLWDARLTSELILLFLYLAIFLFQQAMSKKNAGERAVAILVLVGSIDLPIIHYSVYWWNTLHQGTTLKLFSPSAIDSSMQYPLLAMIAAFLCYYTLVLFSRLRHELAANGYKHWLKEPTC